MRLRPADVPGTVLRRLAVAWALLSAVGVAAAFYVEMARVDRVVLGLAKSAAGAFATHADQPGVRHGDELEQRAAELLRGGFIALRIYGPDQSRLYETYASWKAPWVDRVRGQVHELPLDGAPHHHSFWISGKPFMQVLLPVRAASGEPAGYFEGIYEVDPDTLEDLKAGVLLGLGLTLAVVLVTAGVLYSIIAALNRGLVRLSCELLKSNIDLMEALGSAVAARDSDTHQHNYRVTYCCVRLAEALKLPARQIRDLIAGAFLHDVGKIGISDAILLKPGPLDESELDVMHAHVTLGLDIVAKAGWLEGARDVVEFHHEKYDGSGYLKGLKGEAIPLGARIFAIVDVFDALTSRRPYKEPLPLSEALRILELGRGTHFDPALLDAFLGMAPQLYRQTRESAAADVQCAVRDAVIRHFPEAADTALI